MEYPTTLLKHKIIRIQCNISLTILESIKLLATNFPIKENFVQTLSTTSDGVFGPRTPGAELTEH